MQTTPTCPQHILCQLHQLRYVLTHWLAPQGSVSLKRGGLETPSPLNYQTWCLSDTMLAWHTQHVAHTTPTCPEHVLGHLHQLLRGDGEVTDGQQLLTIFACVWWWWWWEGGYEVVVCAIWRGVKRQGGGTATGKRTTLSNSLRAQMVCTCIHSLGEVPGGCSVSVTSPRLRMRINPASCDVLHSRVLACGRILG